MNTSGKQGIFLSGILGELDFKNTMSFKIALYNRGAFHLASNSNYCNRSKHIAIRFAALRDWIKDGRLVVDHASSSDQFCDILTQYCPRPIFSALCN